MFKTLQNTGGVISIFHNKRLPPSVDLLKILTQADGKFNKDTEKFIVDRMDSTLPTYDQYVHITHRCLNDTYSKNVLRNCFPFVSGKTAGPEGKDRVTVKAPAVIGRLSSNGLKMFSENEYLMIYQAFEEALNSKEFESSEVFKAPLIVDWEQNMIANDEFGLDNILKKYK